MTNPAKFTPREMTAFRYAVLIFGAGVVLLLVSQVALFVSRSEDWVYGVLGGLAMAGGGFWWGHVYLPGRVHRRVREREQTWRS